MQRKIKFPSKTKKNESDGSWFLNLFFFDPFSFSFFRWNETPWHALTWQSTASVCTASMHVTSVSPSLPVSSHLLWTSQFLIWLVQIIRFRWHMLKMLLPRNHEIVGARNSVCTSCCFLCSFNTCSQSYMYVLLDLSIELVGVTCSSFSG